MIKLSHIQRTFQVGDEVVHGLDNVSLDIKDAEYISIMGPSGSGKSTLLNVLGLLDQPDECEYLLDKNADSVKNKIKICFLGAPNALSKPISLVRCDTATSITFMVMMPATIKLTAAIPPRE